MQRTQKKPTSISEHPAERYARDAASGRIVVSRWVKLAAKRHLRDLAEGHKRGLSFDPAAAQYAIDFFGLLRHSKGKWAGEPVALEPWQQFIVWSMFGWKLASGLRRFRTALVKIAKKNGKSTMAAGLALELLVADLEPGAEVYCAATKKDQAKIVFAEAERMRAASPFLKKKIVGLRNNMNVPATNSKFEPLGADEDTLDGPNTHGLIIDEFHAHKTRGVIDVLQGGNASREQPMTAIITTAEASGVSACTQETEYAEKVLEGITEDDSYFAYVATLDQGDDPFEEANWIKANPNLGVSVKPEYLREKATKAKGQPGYLNAFLRFHMNVVADANSAAIAMDKWNDCVGYSLAGTDPMALRRNVLAEMRGRRCFAALDLSSKIDLTSLVLAFEPEGNDPWILVPWFWMPKDNISERAREDHVPYEVWEREGWIMGTPGNYIDQNFIVAEIAKLREQFQFSENLKEAKPEIAFDPWNTSQAAVDLQDLGFLVVEFRQGYQSMSEPTKSFLGMIPAKKIAHLANPVLSWQAKNLMVKTDPAGNVKPTKEDVKKKNDGMVGAIMALGRGLSSPVEQGPSDEPGIYAF